VNLEYILGDIQTVRSKWKAIKGQKANQPFVIGMRDGSPTSAVPHGRASRVPEPNGVPWRRVTPRYHIFLE
jgi:hypothetical protein